MYILTILSLLPHSVASDGSPFAFRAGKESERSVHTYRDMSSPDLQNTAEYPVFRVGSGAGGSGTENISATLPPSTLPEYEPNTTSPLRLSIPQVIVPRFPGHLSALGQLLADLRHAGRRLAPAAVWRYWCDRDCV